MINLTSVSVKLTQFCKEIKQQNLQPKVQLIMLNESCQGCSYWVQPICPWGKTQNNPKLNKTH